MGQASCLPFGVKLSMSDLEQIGWEEIEEAASKMFSVWINGGELKWAREAWGHLRNADLASRQTLLDETQAKLRLVTLARIYQEFCGLAWDENPETPLDYLTEDLEIDPVAVGVLAAQTGSDELEESIDDYELLIVALTAVTNSQRQDIFQCLKKAYGDEIRLYGRFWYTRPGLTEDNEGDEFEVTIPNSAALEYVRNGFRT